MSSPAPDLGRYAAALDRGIALYRAGNVEGAIVAWVEAVAFSGTEIGAHINLSKVLRAQGRAREAEEWLRRARAVPPSTAAAAFDLGQAFFESQLNEEAADLFSQVLSAEPGNRMAGLQLVAALLNLGETAQARSGIGRLLSQFPEDLQVLKANLVVSRRLADAAGILAAARDILRVTPDDAEAVREIAVHSPDPVETAASRAKLQILCRRTPSDIEGWRALAATSGEEGGYAKAVEILEEGIKLSDDPALRLHRALTIPKVPLSNAEIDTARKDMGRHLDVLIARAGERTVKVQQSVGRVPYRLAYQGRNDRPLMEKLAKAHLAIAPDLAWESARLARPRSPRGKIRIGFLSAFLERHSVGKMVRSVIRDLNRSVFEIFVLRPMPARDDVAKAIDATADSVITYPLQLAMARAAIAEADLDILFFADIGMEPLSYYLAFARLARRQVVWPGHPVTTGLSSIDVFISGTTAEPPDAQTHYTEKLVQFSAVPIYEEARPQRPEFDFRGKFNLPRGTLYICPMTEQKFHPDFDELLRQIFERDPRANFAMVGLGGSSTRLLQQRLRSAVPRLEGRLFLLPYLSQPEFVNFLLAADAVLDTPHFSGSGTSRDAAGLGTVIVSIEGAYMRGRLTTGMYRDMGLDHLAIRDTAGYADLAVRIANDLDLRSRLGGEVRAAAPSLILRKQLLRDFESLFVHLMDGG